MPKNFESLPKYDDYMSGKAYKKEEKLFSKENVPLYEFGVKMWRVIELMQRFKNAEKINKRDLVKDRYGEEQKEAIEQISDEQVQKITALLEKISSYKLHFREDFNKDLKNWMMYTVHCGAGSLSDLETIEEEEKSGENPTLKIIEKNQELTKEEKEKEKLSIKSQKEFQVSQLKDLKEYYDQNKDLQKEIEEAEDILGNVLDTLPKYL